MVEFGNFRRPSIRVSLHCVLFVSTARTSSSPLPSPSRPSFWLPAIRSSIVGPLSIAVCIRAAQSRETFADASGEHSYLHSVRLSIFSPIPRATRIRCSFRSAVSFPGARESDITYARTKPQRGTSLYPYSAYTFSPSVPCLRSSAASCSCALSHALGKFEKGESPSFFSAVFLARAYRSATRSSSLSALRGNEEKLHVVRVTTVTFCRNIKIENEESTSGILALICSVRSREHLKKHSFQGFDGETLPRTPRKIMYFMATHK